MRDSKNFRVTVFGGTGFLGCCLVNLLSRRNYQVRVAARNCRPELFNNLGNRVELVYADLKDAQSVSEAVKNSGGVVNAVGMYQETSGVTFDAVHADGAQRLAEIAQQMNTVLDL